MFRVSLEADNGRNSRGIHVREPGFNRLGCGEVEGVASRGNRAGQGTAIKRCGNRARNSVASSGRRSPLRRAHMV